MLDKSKWIKNPAVDRKDPSTRNLFFAFSCKRAVKFETINIRFPRHTECILQLCLILVLQGLNERKILCWYYFAQSTTISKKIGKWKTA